MQQISCYTTCTAQQNAQQLTSTTKGKQNVRTLLLAQSHLQCYCAVQWQHTWLEVEAVCTVVDGAERDVAVHLSAAQLECNNPLEAWVLTHKSAVSVLY